MDTKIILLVHALWLAAFALTFRVRKLRQAAQTGQGPRPVDRTAWEREAGSLRRAA